jgi:hypothetical protein
LIKKLWAERRESKEGKESSKEPGEELVKTLTKMDKLLSQPEERKGLKDRLEENEDLQAINKSVRIRLRKLPPEITKVSGKPSAKRKGKAKKTSGRG